MSRVFSALAASMLLCKERQGPIEQGRGELRLGTVDARLVTVHLLSFWEGRAVHYPKELPWLSLIGQEICFHLFVYEGTEKPLAIHGFDFRFLWKHRSTSFRGLELPGVPNFYAENVPAAASTKRGLCTQSAW
jgi:hypothetical protein